MKKRVGFCTIAFLALCLGVATALTDKPAVRVTPLLKTTNSWDGTQIVYPEGQAELTALLVEIAPGGTTGWHYHPVPSFAFLLEGTLEVTLADGRIKRLQSGEALAEVTNTRHIGRAVSNTPVKLVVFYASSVGQALTINQPPPNDAKDKAPSSAASTDLDQGVIARTEAHK
jgi:quercetin dioxygenase-like cupin family protein